MKKVFKIVKVVLKVIAWIWAAIATFCTFYGLSAILKRGFDDGKSYEETIEDSMEDCKKFFNEFDSSTYNAWRKGNLVRKPVENEETNYIKFGFH